MIDVTEVITNWESYYLDAGQDTSDLRVKLYYPAETVEKALWQVTTEDDTIRLAHVTSTEVVQAFQSDFVPKGDVKFHPHDLYLEHMMIDVFMDPNVHHGNWLGFWAKLKEEDRSKWPFVRWYIEMVMIPQKLEDMELNAIWTGVRGAIVAGDPTLTSGSFTGLDSRIETGKLAADADNRVIPITTGVLSTDPETYYHQVMDFYKEIPKHIQKKIKHINMDDDKVELFIEGKRLALNLNYMLDADETKLKGKNCHVQGLTSMAGSNKIWCTIEGNVVHVTRQDQGENNYRVYPWDKKVKISSNWKEAVDIAVYAYFYVNDQV